MALPIIGDVINLIGGVVDKLVPDKSKAAEMRHEIAMTLVNSDLAQVGVNTVEAAHKSVFVSGWRPAVGWVCVSALAFNYIVTPLLAWAAVIWMPGAIIPQLDISELLTLLFGLLGMGTLRSYDKRQGTATHKI
jgi:hypothetical protein